VGIISGKIADRETLQPLPGVTIRLNGAKFGAVSTREGIYAIDNVPVGRYTVEVKILGYASQSVSDIVVVPKRTTYCNFELTASSIQMKEVVVQADNFSRITEDGSVNSSISFNNEEIRMTPGMPDLFTRLHSIAGVAATAENTSFLVVRGGDPEENLTLIENVEVFSPFHFSSLSGEQAGGTSIIEPKLVDEVSLSTGGFSPVYGDRLSSVTQITLKEPEKRRINGDLSLDMGGLSGFFSGPLTEKTSWMLAGRRGIWDLLMDMMGESFKPRTLDLHGKFLWEPSVEHKISIYGMYSEDQITGQHESEKVDEVDYSDIRKGQGAFGINWLWLASTSGYLRTTGYFNLNKWTLSTGPIDKKDAFGDENIENIYGAKTEFNYKLNNMNRFVIGGDFRAITAKYGKWADYDTLSDGKINQPYNINFNPEPTYKFAAFLQYFINFSDWLNINLGLRQDYFAFTDSYELSPRIGIDLQITKSLRANFASGLFTQFPQYYRIFFSEDNKFLKTEKAWHFILGFDYLLAEDMQIKAEGYIKLLSDLPVAPTDTSKTFLSSGSGYARGIEFTLNKKMSDNLYILLTFSFSQSRRKDYDSSAEYDFRFDRTNMASLMATYKIGDWWEFGLSISYATGFPFTPYDLSTLRQSDGSWYCSLAQKNSDRFPDYFRIDLRADRRFVFESWNLRVFLEIWNLTNHDNIFQYNYSADFQERKSETLFPFMPMLGIAAEF
ncbi:MAG: hypothetical protein QG635_2070, partial [Bacteroidota bacterium]|nr:hypothetical protein [Bacteroidota bacterium]